MAMHAEIETTAARPALRRPGAAAVAAARVERMGALLGTLGLACSVFVMTRLIDTWRVVTPEVPSHEISALGQRLSYPAANLAAVVVALLAFLGLGLGATMMSAAARELAAWRRLRRRLGTHQARRLGDVLVIDDEQPRAFCAGLLRPRVYVSSGTLGLLDEPALRAVLAHERHHARRRDPLRFAAARVLARALLLVPGFEELIHRHHVLAELRADEGALNGAPENRSALARAMLNFAERSRPEDPSGIDPERVDHLLGEPPDGSLPLLPCLLAVSMLGLLAGAAMLAGGGARGSSTLAVPLVSTRPCIVVLATIPALLGLVLRGLLRDRRRIRADTPARR